MPISFILIAVIIIAFVIAVIVLQKKQNKVEPSSKPKPQDEPQTTEGESASTEVSADPFKSSQGGQSTEPAPEVSTAEQAEEVKEVEISGGEEIPSISVDQPSESDPFKSASGSTSQATEDASEAAEASTTSETESSAEVDPFKSTEQPKS